MNVLRAGDRLKLQTELRGRGVARATPDRNANIRLLYLIILKVCDLTDGLTHAMAILTKESSEES